MLLQRLRKIGFETFPEYYEHRKESPRTKGTNPRPRRGPAPRPDTKIQPLAKRPPDASLHNTTAHAGRRRHRRKQKRGRPAQNQSQAETSPAAKVRNNDGRRKRQAAQNTEPVPGSHNRRQHTPAMNTG